MVVLLILGAIAGFSGLGYVIAIAASAPPLGKPVNRGLTSSVYASDGSLLGYIQADEISTPVPLVADPAVAARTPRSRSRTSASTSTAASTTRAIIRAAVTQRQQRQDRRRVARRSRCSWCATSTSSRRARDYERKIREAKLANELENKHSKKLDPRPVPEHRALRHGRRPDGDGRAGRRADLLRQDRQGPDALGVRAAGRTAAGADRLQPVPQPAAPRSRAATRSLSKMAELGYITEARPTR